MGSICGRYVARRVAAMVWLVGAGVVDALAAGASAPFPQSAFKQLLARGERPEIVACIAAGLDRSRVDAHWTQIRFETDVSKSAHVEDAEIGGRLVRRVALHGSARQRSDTGETRRHVLVVCDQSEDSPIAVAVRAE